MDGRHIILTGAAGTGKSTLITALERSGVKVSEEVSRKIINRSLKDGTKVFPWENTLQFVNTCVSETLTLLDQRESTISDRGMLDNLVNLQIANLEPSTFFLEFPYLEYYNPIVFYCPLWKEIYEREPQRPQPFSHQNKVDQLTRKTYIQYGFQLVEIPKTRIEDRVAFVMERLD